MIKKRPYIYVAFTLFLFLQMSCKNSDSVKMNISELENYFEPQKLLIRKSDNTSLIVEIHDSKFIERGTKAKFKWKNYEPYASIGALITSTSLDSEANFDHILVLIKKGGITQEEYTYRVADLIKVRRFVDVSRTFLQKWETNDFAGVQHLLGREILNVYPSVEKLKKALSPVFFNVGISKSELIAFKISEDVASLYMNAYYEDGKAQTYIFNFHLVNNSQDLIAGITTPQE